MARSELSLCVVNESNHNFCVIRSTQKQTVLKNSICTVVVLYTVAYKSVNWQHAKQ